MKPVSIIVPVYGDWPSLKSCIESLQRNVDMSIHRVLLVNDCGPDADMIEKNIKKIIKQTPGFLYYRNPKNLGFVGNCNRAVMELDKTHNDILLLNSDAEVTVGFLDEMLKVLYEDQKTAAVSPRSNNATLATIPLREAMNKGVESAQSYEIFQKIKNLLPDSHPIPVAHGFCMLIRRKCIEKYGLFDTVFDKGYGEEVDFCLRLAAEGYVSKLANKAYVFHLEARSFSLEAKAKLLEANNKIIWERYPEYRESVRNYMTKQIEIENALEWGSKNQSPKDRLKAMIKKNKAIYSLARRVAGKEKQP